MTKNPNFEELLTKGETTYDSEVGSWWIKRCEDENHLKAYNEICKAIKPYVNEKKSYALLDYACGTGILLHKILKKFSNIHGIGIDGSQKLLERYIESFDSLAKIRSISKAWSHLDSKNTSLVTSYLPNFKLPKKKMDFIIWCFPNIVPSVDHLDEFNDNGYQKNSWFLQADKLSTFREMDPEDEVDHSSVEDKLDELLTQRVIHANIASLLKPGGIFIKVEYANCHRSDLSDLTRLKEQFIEGTLVKDVKGLKTKPFFKQLSCKYKKSPVILDVFEQTQDPTDKEGGYTINLFKKL